MTAYPRHISGVSYNPESPSRLQTLDIWLPRPLEESDPAQSLWIIYIHGGAWRDPTQDASCLSPTITHLFSASNSTSYAPALTHIAGIASLNYRLSPHPDHPSSDPDNAATHPTHIQDVARAIAFLRKEYGVKRWIGAGHSCGATLAMQYVSGIGLDDSQHGPGADVGAGPEALILIAGIYSLPLMLRNHQPPTTPENIAAIYRSFVAGAFGADESKYLEASPVSGTYTAEKWKEGRLIMLCHSYADELVERQQRDIMCVTLDRAGWEIVMEAGDPQDEVGGERRVVNVRDVSGSHDEVWEDGSQIARLVVQVVGRLVGVDVEGV